MTAALRQHGALYQVGSSDSFTTWTYLVDPKAGDVRDNHASLKFLDGQLTWVHRW